MAPGILAFRGFLVDIGYCPRCNADRIYTRYGSALGGVTRVACNRCDGPIR
jgi:transposase-like protein